MLAMVKTGAINSFITAMNLWPTSGYIWIGSSTALALGVWRWADTEVLTWHMWHPQQPNGPPYYDSQECLTSLYNGSEWQDKACAMANRFLCQDAVPSPCTNTDLCISGAVWTASSVPSCISGNPLEVYTNVSTQTRCQDLCDERIEQYCMSYDYSSTSEVCTLKSAGANTGQTIVTSCSDAAEIHVERDLPVEDPAAACYWSMTTPGTAINAEVICSNYNMTLATAKSPAENADLLGRFGGQDGLLGLGDADLETVFMWSDGSYPSWTNWDTGHPVTAADGASLDCVKILGSGKWVDIDCSTTLPYVCKLPDVPGPSCNLAPHIAAAAKTIDVSAQLVYYDCISGYEFPNGTVRKTIPCPCNSKAADYVLRDVGPCINIDECLSNPCQNGGTCVDGVDGYACTCGPDHKGTHCELLSCLGVKDPSSGICYWQETSSATWANAQRICQNNGGTLAMVKTDAINTVITNNRLWPSTNFVWIGGSTALALGVWRWTDTEVLTWHMWHPQQPNGPPYSDSQECLTSMYNGGEWQDKACTMAYPFLCQDAVPSPCTNPDLCINGAEWTASSMPSCISGNTLEVYTNVPTQTRCQDLCDERIEQYCMSYDYSSTSEVCTLKSAGVNTGQTIVTSCSDAAEIHVERDLPALPPRDHNGTASPPTYHNGTASPPTDQIVTDLEFDVWTRWTTCSAGCGGDGTRFRLRLCSSHNDTLCNQRLLTANGQFIGYRIANRSCNTDPCPVAGRWSPWSLWSDCEGRCGEGITRRTRLCTAPSPRHGGKECDGLMVDIESCDTKTTCKGVPPKDDGPAFKESDHRPSAKSIGAMEIIMVAGALGLLVVGDIAKCRRDAREAMLTIRKYLRPQKVLANSQETTPGLDETTA